VRPIQQQNTRFRLMSIGEIWGFFPAIFLGGGGNFSKVVLRLDPILNLCENVLVKKDLYRGDPLRDGWDALARESTVEKHKPFPGRRLKRQLCRGVVSVTDEPANKDVTLGGVWRRTTEPAGAGQANIARRRSVDLRGPRIQASFPPTSPYPAKKSAKCGQYRPANIPKLEYMRYDIVTTSYSQGGVVGRSRRVTSKRGSSPMLTWRVGHRLGDQSFDWLMRSHVTDTCLICLRLYSHRITANMAVN